MLRLYLETHAHAISRLPKVRERASVVDIPRFHTTTCRSSCSIPIKYVSKCGSHPSCPRLSAPIKHRAKSDHPMTIPSHKPDTLPCQQSQVGVHGSSLARRSSLDRLTGASADISHACVCKLLRLALGWLSSVDLHRLGALDLLELLVHLE